jgi:N-acetylmuramoyl-L-alanine amidase
LFFSCFCFCSKVAGVHSVRQITHLVVHTAGAPFNVDQSARSIDLFHRKPKKLGGNGWAGIGYNKVIRKDGRVELGRDENKVPAGVLGFNEHTLHVCCTGNGDIADFTPEQKIALTEVLVQWLHEYDLVETFKKNPMRILGHRECYKLHGVPNTGKSCPGKLVDMSAIRKRVLKALI